MMNKDNIIDRMMYMLKKDKWKNTFLYIFLLAVIIIVGVGFSYYNSEDHFLNRFVSSTYDVNVEEEFYDTWGDKKVYFKNTESTNVDVVLRVSYNEYWKDKNGVYLNNKISGTNIVDKTWTNDYTNYFIDGHDGWYYYTKVLSSQEQVQVLDAIQLNSTLVDNSPIKTRYYDGSYHLDFNFEAVQAKNQAILDVWGKNATINGGNVTWGVS